MKHILENNRICAIMRGVPLGKTLDYADAVYRGGVRMFEVAMNSGDAARQIELMRKHFGDNAYVGAGTVISAKRCEAAREAGAQFFLTPSATTGTMEFCRRYDIPLLPGVLTPTDVAVCLEYGYTIMKLFPAGDLPENYIKSLKGPFDGTEYVAVGGVNAGNIGSFFERGFIGVGMGQNMVPREYVEKKQWEEASAYVRGLVQGIRRKSV